MVYLNNIIIYLNSKKEYKKYVEWVLSRLYKENIPVIIKKDWTFIVINRILSVIYTQKKREI